MLIRGPRAYVPADTPYPPARDDGVVTAYLLVELRKANGTIERLRSVAFAARNGDAVRLRAALARLRARDLEWHPRPSRRAS
jgi:hypothetical protein